MGQATSHEIGADRVVGRWTFPAGSAPAAFAVTLTERTPGGELPVNTIGRITTERHDNGPTVEWVATAELPQPPDGRAFRMRATIGEPIDIGTFVAPGKTVRGPALSPDDKAQLQALRAVLAQQPDGGREMVSRIMPSADPDEVLADIEAEALKPGRLIFPFEGLAPPPMDEDALNRFARAYPIAAITNDDARNLRFQTKEDWARYATAKGAPWFHLGGDVDRPLSADIAAADRPAKLTYKVAASELTNGSLEVALFADNGNGLYASRAIAKQIVESKLPYAFHLGDVYYGGTEEEFTNFFWKPYEPMFDRTELFMITGNHEMYGRGRWFNDMVRRKREKSPTRQRQEAETFRLVGDGFQIIGLDTMFVGWDSGRVRVHDYADEALLALLDSWLTERPNDLTILLTTNEAWDKGDPQLTPLYLSLERTISDRVDMWFWGNVHYAALYEPWSFLGPNAKRKMIPSCIGHGGYPFYTERDVGDLPNGAACRWLETKSRFWPEQRVRPDVGLNGWCRMKLTRSDKQWTVGLTYLDWIGRERLRVEAVRKDGESIEMTRVEESELAAVGADPTWHPLQPGQAK